MPHTAIGAQFGKNPQAQYGISPSGQMYSLPDQILAPPALHIEGEEGAGMDPGIYAELVATNQHLAQQQQRLQQQLMEVTAAAQQFQGMSLNSTVDPLSLLGMAITTSSFRVGFSQSFNLSRTSQGSIASSTH